MTNVEALVNQVRQLADCRVMLADGLPRIEARHQLPRDVIDFYTTCGGLKLYQGSPYSIRIVGPGEVSLASRAIFADVAESDLSPTLKDMSWSWYIIAEAGHLEYIAIDLDPSRLGRCYQAFWDMYAMPGNSPIVAFSFSELLERLIANQGQHWYWMEPDFVPLGDAYE